jgi:hypothetical protein
MVVRVIASLSLVSCLAAMHCMRANLGMKMKNQKRHNDIPALNRLLEQEGSDVVVQAPCAEREKIVSAIEATGIQYPVLVGTEEKG